MKTASVREIRQNFGQLLRWINVGEEVTVTMHRKPVARIVPWRQEKKQKIVLPDFRSRRKAIFGKRVLAGNSVLEERESDSW